MNTENLFDSPISELDTRHTELRIAQPRAESAMVESMKRFGQISAVVATRVDETLVLVDGFKRLAAARTLEMPTLTVRTLPLTARAAVAAVYGLNRGGRGMIDLEEALVVRKLIRTLGLTQPEVGALLGRHKSWVSRRLALVERLCQQVQDDIRVGLITPTVGREVARLPRGNQPEVAAMVHRHGLTTREAATLVNLFEQTTERQEQTALLDDPRAALMAHGKQREDPHHDARLGTKANHIRRQALRLAEGAPRLSRLLTEGAVACWLDVEREVLTTVLSRARDAVRPLPEDVATVLEALKAADES